MNSKCIVFLFAVLTLCSCGQSKEERAQQMIAEYLKGELYNFDSYEPIQTKVDSAFVTLVNDKEMNDLTMEMIKMIGAATEYSDKIERAERSMNIWAPYGSPSKYMRGEYDRAKQERDLNQKRLEKARELVIDQFDKIKARPVSCKCWRFQRLAGLSQIQEFEWCRYTQAV